MTKFDEKNINRVVKSIDVNINHTNSPDSTELLPENTDLNDLKPTGFYKIEPSEMIQPETLTSNRDTGIEKLKGNTSEITH